MPVSRSTFALAAALALGWPVAAAQAGPPSDGGPHTPPAAPPRAAPPAPPSQPRATPATPSPTQPRATPPATGGGTAASEGGNPVAVEPERPPQDLSGTWGYSKHAPRTPRYVRTDNPAVYAAPNPIGFYSGVSVAGNHVPPQPPSNFDSKPAMLTWAGFERATEGSRVFFELNSEAQYSVEQKGLTIRIKLRNTKVNVRNNMRALDLRYFKTPVRSVQVRRRGKDTTATIVLKHEAEPQVQLTDGKEGYKLLVVQFADAIAPTDRRTDPTAIRRADYETQAAPPPPVR